MFRGQAVGLGSVLCLANGCGKGSRELTEDLHTLSQSHLFLTTGGGSCPGP